MGHGDRTSGGPNCSPERHSKENHIELLRTYKAYICWALKVTPFFHGDVPLMFPAGHCLHPRNPRTSARSPRGPAIEAVARRALVARASAESPLHPDNAFPVLKAILVCPPLADPSRAVSHRTPSRLCPYDVSEAPSPSQSHGVPPEPCIHCRRSDGTNRSSLEVVGFLRSGVTRN